MYSLLKIYKMHRSIYLYFVRLKIIKFTSNGSKLYSTVKTYQNNNQS